MKEPHAKNHLKDDAQINKSTWSAPMSWIPPVLLDVVNGAQHIFFCHDVLTTCCHHLIHSADVMVANFLNQWLVRFFAKNANLSNIRL